MKLAFLTHEPFYPPSGGGSAEALYLVQEFVRRDHDVHLFGPKVEEPEKVRQKFGVRLHEFTAWRMGRYTPLRNFKYLLYPFFLERMVTRTARHESYDLVFSQHAIAAVAAGRLKKRLRVPVITNFLDYLTGFMETWPAILAPPPALRLLKKFELSIPRRYGVDGVLTVSDTLADFFVDAGYPRERIRPIYYGFDADLFSFRESGRIEADNHPPTVVMHGSLDHHHLRDIAVDAVALVTARKPDVKFKLVGQRTAALESFLQRLGRRVPAAQVHCTGFVPYTEVARHLAQAALGIVPYEESSGTHCAFVAKIVEYLAIGLPVVSTPLNSAQRYFKDEPMIRFSEFNGCSFGEKILSWLREPRAQWEERARQASARVRRELDWRAICRKAVAFIEGIQQAARSP
ncbi:MAG: glycosyltransferase family 4 protein [Verrucomicrobiales bacterium]|nr:glycosyltransferase family 4 protein [Verrucomicrobiales bacterium]